MNYEQVKELISIVEKTDFTRFELSIDGVNVAIGRGIEQTNSVINQVVPQVVSPTLSTQEETLVTKEETAAPIIGGKEVTAPIVGTFYVSASPDQHAFVKAGDVVKKGDVLCIIEAMKFMNEITSEFDGTVAEVCVNDQDMVEYGQPLFKIV